MLGDISVVDDIYIVCGYTDMRKQIDGLYSIVKDQFHMDEYSYAAEPPVQFRLSHLSRRSEPL